MSDDWDVYFTHVEDKPASMLLDLGLAPEAPIPGLSVMCYITVDFLDPDENGFSKRGEYDRLMAIEDALVPAVAHETSIFVGRSTTNGQRDFFFYMDNAKGVEERVEAIMAKFDEYTWDMGLVEEPGWDTYFEYLYPDEQGMDTIWNNRVRRNLESHNDDLAVSREIDHWVQFQTEADMKAFIPEAEREGFRITVSEKTPDKPFELLLQRNDAPDEIDDVTWPLR
ncbi:DUF695 domain-containing protein, partial [Desulfovibrio sp. OttesenSCG-928-O18]|nr:DUF695 domain-containing protein [Desulfovibrio sp. OttesenSCG-928-O18]